ncbi:MAG TPA: DUF58 domain-containing protein [Mycobacterium sp.]
MTDIGGSDVELHWRPSSLTRAVATAAVVALAVAVLGSSWQLVAFAAPLLGVLGSVRWQRRPPAVSLATEPDLLRCFEGEQVTLSVWATTASAAVTVEPAPVAGARVDVVDGQPGQLQLEISAERWGRYPVTVRVDATGFGGLRDGSATVAVADVFVFPVAPPQDTRLPRTELLDRLGTHLTRNVGRGVEYADIRTYVPGDQLRSVNWPVSARRGSLHVTERLSERAADVVVLVDTYLQPPGPATDATERCVRGAVQVVQSALRSGDRAGVVALGGRPRWLGVDIGRRQFYRVLDTVLAAGDGFETATGTLASRAAVPPGAIVVAFSTLIETDFALALIDLCKRGHLVVVVDVLEGLPFAQEQDPLIARMWAMQRSFMYRDMRTIGVDVVSWPPDRTLDQAMLLVPDRRRRPTGGRT